MKGNEEIKAIVDQMSPRELHMGASIICAAITAKYGSAINAKLKGEYKAFSHINLATQLILQKLKIEAIDEFGLGLTRAQTIEILNNTEATDEEFIALSFGIFAHQLATACKEVSKCTDSDGEFGSPGLMKIQSTVRMSAMIMRRCRRTC